MSWDAGSPPATAGEAARRPSDPAEVRPGGLTGPIAVPWRGTDVTLATLLLFAGLAGLLALLAATVRRDGVRPVGLGLTIATVTSTVVTEGALVALALLFSFRRGARWSDFGFRPFPAWSLVLGGAVILIGFGVNLAYAVVIRTLGWERFLPPGARDLLPLFGEGGWGLAVGLGLAGLIAPFAEEIFFRGFVFAGLLRPLGLPAAILVSALVFATVHLQPATVLPIFALGCLLATLYHLTRSLWPSILVHATYNSVALLAAFLAVSRS